MSYYVLLLMSLNTGWRHPVPVGNPGPAPISVLVPPWLMQGLVVPGGVIFRSNKSPSQGTQSRIPPQGLGVH